MSNALAIAAVTQTLVNLIQNELRSAVDPTETLQGIHVTALPPDAANNDNSDSYQVNLFLYHAMPNAAWRNMPTSTRTRPGDNAQPPLALNLYYMITAYARQSTEFGDIDSHNLLGHVMRILFDHPILSGVDITLFGLPGSGVENQVERVRITMQPLTIEEIYRLWTGFQTQYRLSVSYEVAVILIDSNLGASTPLPVLKLGATGRGAAVVPDVFPYPVLFSVQLNNAVLPIPPGNFGGLNPANVPPVALPGDKLVIQGHRLSGPQVIVSFASAAATPAIPVVPDANTDESVTVTIPPDTTGSWPYGYYTLSVVITSPNPIAGQPPQVQTTNALAVALAPQIDSNTIPKATRNTSGDVAITLNSVQQVLPGQNVSLLLNELEVQSDPRTGMTNALSFSRKNIRASDDIPAGDYLMRLRVDGVDSFPFVRTGYPQQPFDPIKNPPVFDPNQRITIP